MEHYTNRRTETVFATYHVVDPEQEKTFILRAFQKDSENIGFKLLAVNNKTQLIVIAMQSHVEKEKFNMETIFKHFEDLFWKLPSPKPEYALTAVKSVADLNYLPVELRPFTLPRKKQGLSECKHHYAGEITIYNDALNSKFAKYYAFA